MSWFIAKSKPRKEQYLISNLTHWGVETYYPYIRRPGRQGHLEPLFSTYVFCRFDEANPRWQAIRWAQGLSYFLTSGGRLSTVPDTLISYLMDRTRSWNGEAHRRVFERGEHVGIVNGPFSGLEAVFQAYVPSRQRCQVLLQLVGGIRSVELPEASVGELGNSWKARLALESV
jgi:transcriptional antiterminator RfaH